MPTNAVALDHNQPYSILKFSLSLLLPKYSLKKCKNSLVNARDELRFLHNKVFHTNQLKMSTVTESISMNLGKDQSIDKDNMVVNNDTTVVSTIVDVLEGNEEIEELSIISGFEMSDLQMAELVTVTNQVNTICNSTVAVSVSVENNKALREIAYDTFMTNDQLVNWKMKKIVDDWNDLKKR